MIEKIKELREYEAYSMREVATKIGVAKSTYSAWEYGRENIPLKHLVSLSKLYKVNINYLIGKTSVKSINNKYTLDAKLIGQKLRKIREKNHLTQKAVADYLNINQPTWCNYETGKYLIKTLYLIGFANKTKSDIDKILTSK